ncbi:MAG: hypothetical protein AAGA47_03045 [Pseudomonadota bacterium]
MKKLLLTTALAAFVAPSAHAQTATPPPAATDTRPAGAEAFTPENAILNTAIPFAVGAREAQQTLRSAFGWPTFQEGLVQGVYFRFDPDGYARFSPSPRLDTDVFEVICRARTYTCMARKGPMGLVLTSDGRVQMQIDQAQATDTFALNDGFSELQIPPRLNGILDPQMEILLSGGGTLVIRRNGEVFEELSLQGFSAVLAYLRWVAARQDYSVLPRDWPVPNGTAPSVSTTNPGTWPNATLRSAPVLQGSFTPGSEAAAAATVTTDTPEMAALRSEVSLLRDLLLAQTGGTPPAALPATIPVTISPAITPMSPSQNGAVIGDPLGQTAPMGTIATQLDALRQDMGLSDGQTTVPHTTSFGTHAASHGTQDALGMAAKPREADTAAMDDGTAELRHLRYLTSEMGLDGKTALLILQMSMASASGEPLVPSSLQPSASATILQELAEAMAPSGAAAEPVQELFTAARAEDEYDLLGTYFRSVLERN